MKNHLKSIREARGLTQAQLVEASGYSLDTIKSWETGRRELRDVYACLKLCDVLGCELRDLIE